MKKVLSRLSFPVQLFIAQFVIIFACALLQFKNLSQWDSEWYAHILRHGYSATLSADPTVPNLGNVGFFPGFPISGWIVQKILSFGGDSFSPEYSLIIASLIFTLLTWFLAVKWLDFFGDRFTKQKILLFALYPFTIFFYYAYTEALFCAGCLGYFYFTERFFESTEKNDEKKAAQFFALALICGNVFIATRFFGVVFAAYPIIRSIQLNREKVKSFLLGIFSYVGMALFYIYCQVRFGAWDFYFISKRAIWKNIVDYSKLLPPKLLFDFNRPTRAETTGKMVAILTGVYLTYRLVALLRKHEWKKPELAMVLICGMFWGESILAMTSWDFACLGRYLVPVLLCMLPFMNIKPQKNWRWFAIAALFFGLQIAYALKFSRHGWVA